MSSDQLGSRIRTFREMKKVTFEELCERTGLAPDFLRAVEEEGTYPSLGPLLKISRALGVRLGTFLDDHATDDPLIVRMAERQEEFYVHTGKDSPVAMKLLLARQGEVGPPHGALLHQDAARLA